jgi:rhamnogalacturonyl hydrolase YesR
MKVELDAAARAGRLFFTMTALIALPLVSACAGEQESPGKGPAVEEDDAASTHDASVIDAGVVVHEEAAVEEDARAPALPEPEPEPALEAGPALDAGVDAPPPVLDAGRDAPGTLDPDVVSIMRKVADWQLPRAGTSKDWIHGAMWTGIMATFVTTRDAKYLDAVKTWAGDGSLTGGAAARGDNQCAAQTFFDAYLLDPRPTNLVMVNGAKPSFDALVANPPPGRTEWWWADALFMVPPGFARLGAITGDAKYFQVMNTMWWDSYAFLFSPANGLVYRDMSFFNGTTFWSRGNGWVVAGIARILDYLPADDAKRADYAKALNTMFAALRPLQHADGLWPADLLHGATAGPETSGTGFFTFAIAWAVNHGVVDRATYAPVARRAWAGLVSHVDANGKLGYVQNVGDRPAPAAADETHEYGVGAFLLAGSEVAKLGL